MHPDPNLDPNVIPVTERLLTEFWGNTVHLGEQETLREDKCYRFRIADAPAGSPASVIIKKARRDPGYTIDPDAREWNPAQRFLEEWAGLQFLNELAPDTGLAPKLYGGDRVSCIAVFEDFGVGSSLAEPLMGNDPDYARECLALHAHAVADLHAQTLGKAERYWQIRDALGPRGVDRDSQGWGDLRRLRAELQRSFDHIGQSVSTAFWDEYEYLIAVIDHPEPFYAYVHNDSCPENSFLESDRLRLIDFERGGYHLCLLDAAYCRLYMPHCYLANRLPDDIAPYVEQVYRRRLGKTLPDALNDSLFGRKMAEACAYWVISNGTWLVHRNFDTDFTWGISTWWQRVFLRLEQFATTTETFSHLPVMGETARETLRRLKTVWNCEPMPLYPAFR